jgi:hypothetical protein
MEEVALGTLAAGTLVSAFGKAQAGNQQATADTFNQKVATENASIAGQEATSQAAIDKVATERTEGAITAAYGAGGVDPDRGTPLDVLFDQAATGKLNQNLDLYKGEVASVGDLDQANLYGYQAQTARQAGTIGAAATILSGVGQTAFASRLPWGSPTTPPTTPSSGVNAGTGYNGPSGFYQPTVNGMVF